jgi:hypothetical protein
MDASTMWFPLPSRIGGTSDSPELFEIRGIRGVKLTDEDAGAHDWEYWFTIDRPEGEEVVVDLHFDQRTRFTQELPTLALERGREIAQRLLGTTLPKTIRRPTR